MFGEPPVSQGILTAWRLRPTGRTFIIEDSTQGRPCYRDRSGQWFCDHVHEIDPPLQDVYQDIEGWTVQQGLVGQPQNQVQQSDEDRGQHE